MTLTPDLLIELAKAGATIEVGADGSFVVIGTRSASDKQSKGNAARCSRYRQRKQEACQTMLDHVAPMSQHVESCQTHISDTQTPPLSPSLPLPPQTPPSPAHPHTPAPVRTREAQALELDGSTKPAKTNGKGTLAELEAYAVEIGLLASDGTAMFDHWTANGWRNGSSPSKCWKAGMRKWKGRGWMPSQTGRQSGFNGHRPKHAAYDAKTATAGMSQDDILKF